MGDAHSESVKLARLLLVLVVVTTSCSFFAPPSDAGLTFLSTSDVIDAMDGAKTVRVAAYALYPGYTSYPTQAITRAIESDVRAGAHVELVLDRDAFGKAAQANEATVSELLRLGCRQLPPARCVVRYSPGPSHIKAAIVDDRVFLSDTNFTRAGLVVEDAIPGDRALLVAAIDGRSGSNDHLWTRKADAIDAEARVAAARSANELDVASESFGAGTPVYELLQARARGGDRVRLLVAAREAYASTGGGAAERAALAQLACAGVDVRLGWDDEKLLVDGDALFIGSANASPGEAGQVDFGVALRSDVLANAVSARFAGEWAGGRPLPGKPCA